MILIPKNTISAILIPFRHRYGLCTNFPNPPRFLLAHVYPRLAVFVIEAARTPNKLTRESQPIPVSSLTTKKVGSLINVEVVFHPRYLLLRPSLIYTLMPNLT